VLCSCNQYDGEGPTAIWQKLASRKPPFPIVVLSEPGTHPKSPHAIRLAMNAADIPSQTLAEVYQAIAERRGLVSPHWTNRVSTRPSLWLRWPMCWASRSSKSKIDRCIALQLPPSCAELETDALRDYQIVPLARRAETLIVISSCPWNPITAEVLLGYFQPCSQVKFVLASPACLRELLNRLKPAEQKTLCRPATCQNHATQRQS